MSTGIGQSARAWGWLQRPLAILAAMSLISLFPTRTFDLITYSLLIAHYIGAAIFFPWGRAVSNGTLRPQLALIFLAAFFGLAMFTYGFPPIILYFCLHFVFTELYEDRAEDTRALRAARGLFYASAYLLFMRWHIGFGAQAPVLWGVTLLALAARFALTASWRDRLSDFSFLLPLAGSMYFSTRFTYVLIYHVMLWWMIPVVRGGSAGSGRALKLLGALSIFFLVVILGSSAWNEALYWAWSRETVRLGYVHVTLTFVMSSLNPSALRALVAASQKRLAGVV